MASSLQEHHPPLGAVTKHLAKVFGIHPRPLDIHTSCPYNTSWLDEVLHSHGSIDRGLSLLDNTACLSLCFAASSASYQLLGHGPRYA
ncbi:hypothetical protein TSAR_005304 [Trichomalopsis sarcophagae]|uniref:Uncharacterized protein n=1 Tax=Trichomalopsis sarcophagae TaxID=543379 RepID=A0A232EVK9_9HYME|nr:hypothetical protein TSAR_005304 [Trichomalopsis sarcophagae]